MYRVTIYKDKRLIATFLEDLMSVAVGKAQRIGNKNDEVYIHEVIESVNREMKHIIDRQYQIDFNVPLLLESKIGNNWLDTK